MNTYTLGIPVKAVPGSNRKIAVNGRIIDVAKGKAGMTAQVKIYAQVRVEELGWQIADGPGAVSYRIFFARPKSHFRTGRNAALLRDTAPHRHAQRPDLINLLKCLEDALTGVVWKDDSLVAEMDAVKFWGEQDRIEIEVTRLHA